MSKNYKQILKELAFSIYKLRSDGIKIDKLDESYLELKKHSENIEKIENNIEAIREEVIDRIKIELDQNKTAGKFSIWGFWIGIIALVVTTVSISIGIFEKKHLSKDEKINMSSYQHKNLQENDYDSIIKIMSSNINKINNNYDTITKDLSSKISRIDNNLNELTLKLVGFDDSYKPDFNELFIKSYNKPKQLITSNKSTISISCKLISEELINGKLKPYLYLIFHLNNKKMGINGLKTILQLNSKPITKRYNKILFGIQIFEGDKFLLFNKFEYKVERIYRTESNILRIPDNKEGVLIKLITKVK